MTTSEFTSRMRARPGFRRSDISAQRPPWMSAICDEMCRTGADTTFKRKERIETCKKFLLKEKEFARLRDEFNQQ
jgi:hypothetical protein